MPSYNSVLKRDKNLEKKHAGAAVTGRRGTDF
jgi:hypothetical protein